MRLIPAAVIFAVWGCMAQETQAPASRVTGHRGSSRYSGCTGSDRRSRMPVRHSPEIRSIVRSTFPVAIDGRMAIPPGTYLKGTSTYSVRPTRFSNQAEFRMYFTQMIFASGYTVETAADRQRGTLAFPPAATFFWIMAPSSKWSWNVRSSLDSAKVAAAMARSQAPQIGQWKSATQCRPIPPTPGTSDTYIPGTPGTPSTTVPGGPGMPDIIIPGSPAHSWNLDSRNSRNSCHTLSTGARHKARAGCS